MAPPCHGFEDALSADICKNCRHECGCTKAVQLAEVLQNFKSHQLKDRMLLYRLWKLALGPSAPSFQNVYVVGDRKTLHDLAPNRGKGYPSFLTPLEYKPDDEEDTSTDGEDEEEEVEPLLTVDDGAFVILLPGEYESSQLWGNTFTGTNLVVGLGIACVENNSTTLECKGRTCFGRLVLETYGQSPHESLISVSGSLRLMMCAITPEPDCSNSCPERPGQDRSDAYDERYHESGHLVVVQHGAGLLAQATFLGPSTSSCIYCEGQCVVCVDESTFSGAGAGERYRRMCKANGTFPSPLQGRFPAISISYAATVQAINCTFEANYGYPIQYSSKAEQEGSIDQKDEDAEAEERHIQGTVMVSASCSFKNNALSPYLPELCDGLRATVEPWFAEDSPMMELVDAENGLEPREPFYMHAEARSARDIWESAFGDETSRVADVFDSLAADEDSLTTLTENFAEVRSYSSPIEAFSRKRRQAIEIQDDSELYTFYGMLTEPEKRELRATMLSNLQHSCESICNVVEDLVSAQGTEELVWGCLTDKDISFEDAIVAEAAILALHDKTGRPISPYRAEVLVERIQCNRYIAESCFTEDGCECSGNLATAKKTAFMLCLSHETVVEALFSLLEDPRSSNHGVISAGEILSCLAFLKPELRDRVVEVLSKAVGGDRAMSSTSSSSLVLQLGNLHAKESLEIVERASLNGMVDGELFGGLVGFLKRVGLPVDLTNPAVDQQIRTVCCDVLECSTERGRQQIEKTIARRQKEIAKHNAVLKGKPPCAQCGKRPPTGKEFPVCTRCLEATYCGKECQRVAWQEHKKVCQPKKQKGKK